MGLVSVFDGFETNWVRRRRSRRSRAGRRRVGKMAWRVRRGGLLVGGRDVEVVSSGFGVGRLLRRDSRKAWGLGRGGGCGIGGGRRPGDGGAFWGRLLDPQPSCFHT